MILVLEVVVMVIAGAVGVVVARAQQQHIVSSKFRIDRSHGRGSKPQYTVLRLLNKLLIATSATRQGNLSEELVAVVVVVVVVVM